MGVTERQGSADDPADKADAAPLAFFMYVLACADGTLYTGYTTDVEQRVRAHNAGKGAKYTRSRLPVKVVAQARFATKHEALSAEFRFKRLPRRAKEALVVRGRTEELGAVLTALWSEEAPIQGEAKRGNLEKKPGAEGRGA